MMMDVWTGANHVDTSPLRLVESNVEERSNETSPDGKSTSPLPFHPVKNSAFDSDDMSESDARLVGDVIGRHDDHDEHDAHFSRHRNEERHNNNRATISHSNQDSQAMGRDEVPNHISYRVDHPVAAPYAPEHQPTHQPPEPMRYASASFGNYAPPPNGYYPSHFTPYNNMMTSAKSSDSSSHYRYPGPPRSHYPGAPSFESHASSSSMSPPFLVYAFGQPPPHPGQPPMLYHPGGYPHLPYGGVAVAAGGGPPPPMMIEYVNSTDVTPKDVLCGRGGATNSHSGNREFRTLVKNHQEKYLKAKKRDKPSVADRVVKIVRKRGGRFLRRCETAIHGQVFWVDIGDDRAREKTCQALREGAPEIRRRKKRRGSSSTDDDDSLSARKIRRNDSEEMSPVSSPDRGPNDDNSPSRDDYDAIEGSTIHVVKIDSPSNAREDRGITHNEDERKDPASASAGEDVRDDHGVDQGENVGEETVKDEPMVIRPCARLMQRSFTTEITMEELTPHEREMYLRGFLPPGPTIRKESTRKESYLIARPYEPVAQNDADEAEEDDDDCDLDDDEPWIEAV